jgi:hypothetical protein
VITGAFVMASVGAFYLLRASLCIWPNLRAGGGRRA